MLQLNFTIQVECIQMARSNMRLILDCFVCCCYGTKLIYAWFQSAKFFITCSPDINEIASIEVGRWQKVDVFTKELIPTPCIRKCVAQEKV